MRKKISVLGMELDNSSYSEALTIIEKFLSDTAVSTVLSVDVDMLALAEQDETVRQQLQEADYTVICDAMILEAAGSPSFTRTKEISSKHFYEEFMKLVYHLDKTVCLIGAAKEDNQIFREFLLSHYANLRIVGEVTASGQREENETAVNTVNTVTPDVVLSILPSPLQEEFLKEHKQQVSARIWYGLLPDIQKTQDSGRLASALHHYFQRRALRSRIKRYEEKHR